MKEDTGGSIGMLIFQDGFFKKMLGAILNFSFPNHELLYRVVHIKLEQSSRMIIIDILRFDLY